MRGMRLLLVAGLVALVAGCSSVSDEVGERVAEEVTGAMTDSDIEIDADEGEVRFSDGEEEASFTAGEGVDLPESFPSELALPSSLEPFGVFSQTEDGAEHTAVQLRSTEAVDAVEEALLAAFEDGGYAVEDTFSQESEGMYMAGWEAVGHGTTVVASLQGVEDEVSVQLLYGPED
ncbi:MAG: hypothetical protein ACQETV_09705 [Actinomycetota bacterium]